MAAEIRRIQSCDLANHKFAELKKSRDTTGSSLIESYSPEGTDTRGSDEATAEMSLKSSDATTLIEGALPVREFPDNLTSEPAPISKSSIDSFGRGDNGGKWDRNTNTNGTGFMKSRSDSFAGTHQEELRCVIAIVRHGTCKRSITSVVDDWDNICWTEHCCYIVCFLFF